jgi:hypothetical protein
MGSLERVIYEINLTRLFNEKIIEIYPLGLSNNPEPLKKINKDTFKKLEYFLIKEKDELFLYKVDRDTLRSPVILRRV